MQNYFEYQGNGSLTGSRDASRKAFQFRLIGDGETWMGMIKSRNQSPHTSNQKTAEEIAGLVLTRHFSLFQAFESRMTELAHAA